MYLNKSIKNYFLILFSIIPISIIIGPMISLINILLIDISFIILILIKRDFSLQNKEPLVYLAILYFYLIFNSFISINSEIGLARNLGFLRIIIFFVAVNYFFNEKIFYNKVFLIWIMIITFVLLDIYLESLTGKNVLGYKSQYNRRIVSFFKNEPIVGGFINAFYLIIIGFLFQKFGGKYKNILIIITLIVFVSIFLTGERSNSIKALLGIIFFYALFREFNIKKKSILFLSGIIIFLTILLSSEYLRYRYVDQIKDTFVKDKKYFQLYKSGFEVFKDNMIFGVGNKNYRVATCSKNIESNNISKYSCTTHPHQIYFELLSEHGIIGTFLILYIFYKLVVSKLLFISKKLNYIQLGSSIYITLIFVPLLPSGAIFSDYSITLIGLNLALFYATNEKTNIFSQKNKF
tara:strand:+ start:604 stop:1824 length:1221 start_codon:yes stop_codon:yes gene_type:complete